jgi:DNA-binding SARP family transcriptional activator
MFPVKVCLFGHFSVLQNDRELKCFPSAKARELFCYLLLHRDRFHCREVLASLLWSDCSESQSRKYFRQTLWQLQQALQVFSPNVQVRGLHVEGNSLKLDADVAFWLDIADFERAFAPVRGIGGEAMNGQQSSTLRNAVALYRGDLLEGCFQDWCLYHRERFQSIYISMLDKLMEYSESHREYESGLSYGERLLGLDSARERTYCKLMRLHYFAGDRSGALRQFHRCNAALDKELGVKPSKRTIELHEQIRTDGLKEAGLPQPENLPPGGEGPASSPAFLPRLKRIRAILKNLQHRVERDIREVDRALANQVSEHPSGRN